jgi:Arc/MetJ-type ribon-helix-helix transcriptional regulator
MTMSVEIPRDLQPLIEMAVAKGHYRNEQELVTDLLRLAIPAMDDYRQLRSDVQRSVDQLERGEVKEADFESVRKRLCEEFDDSGNPK